MTDALVIGAGPAGLMAAEIMAVAGLSVIVVDQKPSVGRKFLMAGKSGLNLTKHEPPQTFAAQYPDLHPSLRAALAHFGPADVVAWAEGLGQDVFTGSTGRVFPKTMKASPLLRAWLSRLDALGVQILTRHRWLGNHRFEMPDGRRDLPAQVTILAVGGASWPRLGSDGQWARQFPDHVTPFQPSNMGARVAWSAHMVPHFGTPLKNIAITAATGKTQGEAVLTAQGIEGGGIYIVSDRIRTGLPLVFDLLPDLSLAQIETRLAKARPKDSLSNSLRKTLNLPPAKIALLQEVARPLTRQNAASHIKSLSLLHDGPMPLEDAISTTGGLRFNAVDETFMLRDRPGWFACGEMLDWEAPTGGYLITACLATGRLAGQGAVDYLNTLKAA